MEMFTAERTRLVVAHESAQLEAPNRLTAQKEFEALPNHMWRIEHLSATEAHDRTDLLSMRSRRIGNLEVEYKAKSWRLVAIAFGSLALLKSIGVI